MSPRLKSVVEGVGALASHALLRSGRSGGRGLVLAYHNIVPDDAPLAGDSSLHLPVRAFGRQLDLLLEYCDLLPLEQVVGSEPSKRLAVAITFDDAYRGALALGAAELARRSIPATMFVPPGLLDGHTFWWDDYASGHAGLPVEFRERALTELRGADSAIRALVPAPEKSLPGFMHSGSEAELASFAAMPRFTLGAHSWSHPNLTALTGSELESELRAPLDWLRARFAMAAIGWIAYPYGLTSATVQAAAAAAGYQGGLRVEGGRFRRGGTSPLAIPRLNISSGLSLDGFALRLAGLSS